MKHFRHFILKITMLLIAMPSLVFAERTVGLGGVASSMMAPVGLATSFLHSGCYIIGAAFLFASFVKYMDHRRSPTMVPISTVIFLVIAGLTLIAIPIFTK
jgi:hypothetical protein